MLYWYNSTHAADYIYYQARESEDAARRECGGAAACVLIQLYMCPHTTIYVPSYYYIFTTRHVRVRALRAGSVVVELGIAREAGDVQQVVRILHISTNKASKAY